ncbi:NFACT RNA binding domain-containing protein [Vulgatibacter incomptus]|uniref:Fibronectin/fibrinogen-binding protein n=1 Tax=Vulgatibacter incomptus TaxID=1391653 RepID=A0A0K1PFY4_9BACT|nr:NFACT family protein [Vulgatibacter incomptus]AKU92326.1 Fibronectin/fibrinogen-binding protein [Vulgatibacter incomptus]
MSLSASELAAVVAELQPFAGGTIQKIWAATPRTVVFELRVPGETHQLLVSADPDETRLHGVLDRPPSPASPLPIQNLLRARLLPSRLVAIEAVPDERIARLRFETPGGEMHLEAELTGRHGNLILVGADGRIAGVAVPSASSTRAILPGQPYEPPPPHPARRAPPDRFQADPSKGPFSLSLAIEDHYGPVARERLLVDRRREASRAIYAARKRLEGALVKIESEEKRAKGADELRHLGDLLLPVASRIPRGARSFACTDYTEEGPVEVHVPLRPELSPRDNVDRYYKEYRRMKGARERIAARREELSERVLHLGALAERLAAAESESLIDELSREAAAAGARPRAKGRKEREEKRPPYRGYVSASGRPIWVGRGAKANDELTFHVARGNDLWLHARGVPGAHVVVPLGKSAAPDEQTLLDACALATHFSNARGEAVAEIAHTRVRHVRKPKGSAPGAVLYVQEKALPYRHDPERLARLLTQEPD